MRKTESTPSQLNGPSPRGRAVSRMRPLTTKKVEVLKGCSRVRRPGWQRARPLVPFAQHSRCGWRDCGLVASRPVGRASMFSVTHPRGHDTQLTNSDTVTTLTAFTLLLHLAATETTHLQPFRSRRLAEGEGHLKDSTTSTPPLDHTVRRRCRRRVRARLASSGRACADTKAGYRSGTDILAAQRLRIRRDSEARRTFRPYPHRVQSSVHNTTTLT